MMDLSDGLATDLRRLADESRVGASVRLGWLPVDAPTRGMAEALGRDPLRWATSGGEDYELLLTCEVAAFERLRSGLARALGTRLTAIGEVTPAAQGLRFVDDDGRPVTVRSGYEHFGGTPTDG
jgi:thiamine-monophosphate kinase